MTTFFLTHENDSYEVQSIGLSIFFLKRNRAVIKFNQCPDEVQEAIVTQLEANVLKHSNHPYEHF